MKITPIIMALAMLVSAHSDAFARLEGRIHELDIENKRYTIEEAINGRLHVFDFKPTTVIRIDRRKYHDLSVLNVGEEVVYKKKTIEASPVFVEAEITSLDLEGLSITFVDVESGLTKTYPFDANVKQGARLHDVRKLRPGDKVVLKVEKK